MLLKKKTTSYLLYALGEILLVMIGILLALQVNNWNENRKLKRNIDNTLRTISSDLETDTLFAANLIKFYEANQENSLKIINREITMDNYKECPECASLVTIYQAFNVQKKGFDLLKNLVDDQSSEKDSLITDITKFYSVFIPVIEKSNDRMEHVVMRNFTDFEKFPWFVDLSQGRFNEDLVKYFVESEDYRKRVASHSILAAGNHLNAIRQYKINAVEIMRRIDERLKDKD
ncbi:MAG: hypothetical protein HKN54_06250 [Flavobacteriaceae bacterium]|nr:hypothetical protein [Flavobacteriaceae bacterium]